MRTRSCELRPLLLSDSVPFWSIDSRKYTSTETPRSRARLNLGSNFRLNFKHGRHGETLVPMNPNQKESGWSMSIEYLTCSIARCAACAKDRSLVLINSDCARVRTGN